MNADRFKEAARGILPPAVLRSLRNTRNSLQRAVRYPSAYLHPWRLDSIRKLNQYHNRYKGERCFVMGNGPSLRHTDLSPLRNEYTFGMNRVYLAFEEWDFRTSFLVSVNDLVIEQCRADFHQLDMPKFFSWRAKDALYPHRDPDPFTHFLFTTYTGPKFASKATERMWEGATVTYVCLQLAFHMGFDPVILIGVDHSFTTKGKANLTVVSQGEDPDHFHGDYFGKGFRWQLPDLETSEAAYRLAKRHYHQAGRQVLDATIGGQLSVFPKAEYSLLVR